MYSEKTEFIFSKLIAEKCKMPKFAPATVIRIICGPQFKTKNVNIWGLQYIWTAALLTGEYADRLCNQTLVSAKHFDQQSVFITLQMQNHHSKR